MKKVEIEFTTDFSGNAPLAIPLGRLRLGNHIARLVFSPTGQLVLVVSRTAVEDGAVILTEPQDQNEVYSFGKTP